MFTKIVDFRAKKSQRELKAPAPFATCVCNTKLAKKFLIEDLAILYIYE